MKAKGVATAAVLIGLFSLVALNFRRQPVQIGNVREIGLSVWNGEGGTNSISIVDPNEVAALMATLRLKPKEPCPCVHMREVVLEIPGQTLRASVCDHCFDLLRSNRVENYWMPQRFWRLMNDKLSQDQF